MCPVSTPRGPKSLQPPSSLSQEKWLQDLAKGPVNATSFLTVLIESKKRQVIFSGFVMISLKLDAD